MLTALLLFIPFDELVAALKRMPPEGWLLALAAYLTMHLIGITKWRLLINTAGAGLSFGQAARCYYYGLFGNLFLPSIVGGDVVRAGLAVKYAESIPGLVLGSLVDRIIDILGLAALAGIGALLLPTALDARSRAVFTGLAVIVGLAGLAAVVTIRLIPFRRLPWKVRRRAATVRKAIRALDRRRRNMIFALLLGMLLQFLLTLMNAALGDAIGINISFVVWLFVWPLGKVAAVLPVTQGGIGVREAAIVALFQPFGVGAPEAMAVGLVFEGVIITGGLLGGGIALILGQLQGRARTIEPASSPG